MNKHATWYPFSDGDGYTVLKSFRLKGECFENYHLAISPNGTPVEVSLSPKENRPQSSPRKWGVEWTERPLEPHEINMWENAGILRAPPVAL